MFSEILTQLKKIFIGVLIATSSIFGFQEQSNQEVSAPMQEVTEAQKIATSEPDLSSTPSAIPSSLPKTSNSLVVTPTPTGTPQIDLNIERVLLWPQKFRTVEAIERNIEKQEYVFNQSNKIESISISIRNNGHEDAKEVVVNLIVDGETLSQFIIDRIERQNYKNESRKLTFPSRAGKHRVELQVNPARLFPETRFDNNTRVFEYEYLD